MSEEENQIDAQELDWYNLESKLRTIIFEQLQQVYSRLNSSDKLQEKMQKKLLKDNEKIQLIEAQIFYEKTGKTVVRDILDWQAKFETKFKQFALESKTDIYNIQLRTGEQQKYIQDHQKSILNIQSQVSELDKRLNTSVNNLSEVQKQLLETIKQLDKQFHQQNKEHINFIKNVEDIANGASGKGSTNQIEISHLRSTVDELRREIIESLKEMEIVKDSKVDIQSYTVERQALKQDIIDVQLSCRQVSDDILKRDNTIQKYIPIKIQKLISDALYASLPQSRRLKLANYEYKLARTYNYSILESTVQDYETYIEQVLEDMKKLETRTTQIIEMNKKKQSNVKQLEEVQPIRTTKRTDTILAFDDKEDAPINPGIDPEQLNDQISATCKTIISNEIQYVYDYIKEQTKIIQQQFKAGDDEIRTFVWTIEATVDSFDKQIQKFQGDNILEINKIINKVQQAQQSQHKYQGLIQAHSKMIACLVENLQMQSLLEIQEENDRRAFNEKQSSKFVQKSIQTPVPQSYYQIQQKCVSCNGARPALQSVKATVAYSPSPLLYRNNYLQREDLIFQKAEMIKRCWNKVENKIKLTQQDINDILGDLDNIEIEEKVKVSTAKQSPLPQIGGRLGSTIKSRINRSFNVSI